MDSTRAADWLPIADTKSRNDGASVPLRGNTPADRKTAIVHTTFHIRVAGVGSRAGLTWTPPQRLRRLELSLGEPGNVFHRTACYREKLVSCPNHWIAQLSRILRSQLTESAYCSTSSLSRLWATWTVCAKQCPLSSSHLKRSGEFLRLKTTAADLNWNSTPAVVEWLVQASACDGAVGDRSILTWL